MDAHGFVRITGRANDMIIRGGENLFPAEIENVVIAHPGVVEVTVIGVPDPFWGEVAIMAGFRRLGKQVRIWH